MPADAAGEFSIVNRLSGKVIDVPTPTCDNDNGCHLQQWDSNGGWQQQWQFVPQGAPPPSPPPSGVTILVNGSFDGTPDWMNASDPEYQAIAATFGDQPIAYHWSPNSEVLPPYVDIFNGASDFANFVNNLNIPASQTLSVVAHSHGGNVVKIASWNISHPINYLVNLGTPVNWDLYEFNWVPGNTKNFCQVSSLADEVQFFGSSPLQQINPYLGDEADAGYWLDQEAQDLYNEQYDAALYDAEMVAYDEADAFYWWMSAKLDLLAWNVTYTDLSHSDLHTAGVWGSIAHNCGLSN